MWFHRTRPVFGTRVNGPKMSAVMYTARNEFVRRGHTCTCTIASHVNCWWRSYIITSNCCSCECSPEADIYILVVVTMILFDYFTVSNEEEGFLEALKKTPARYPLPINFTPIARYLWPNRHYETHTVCLSVQIHGMFHWYRCKF